MLEAAQRRTSFHHQPEAQHPKSSAIHKSRRPITPSIGGKADIGQHLRADPERDDIFARAKRREAMRPLLRMVRDYGEARADELR
ncbi:MAG: hypothetical protein WB041_16085, partial [Pseudolabrys sp.]